jgi:alkylation response protein AidB-like acyl-CoA dehydrogenase
MNFDYNEEQQLLADSVRRFLQKDYDFETRRRILASAEGWSAQAWSTFAQMGLTGLPLPADCGGFGGGAVDLMGVMEACGEALVLEPYVPTLLGALFVARGGSAEQKGALLARVAEGTLRLAFAHTEAGARYDVRHVRTSARAEGGGWVLEGEKRLVVGAPLAAQWIVSARAGGEVALFLVDAAASGIHTREYRTLDGLRAADARFSGVRAARLEGGIALLEELTDFATALVCADAVGAMKYACDATLEYLKARKQFGVPIGTFQALQHRIVDMYISHEQARSMACLACSKADQASEARERARSVSAAKIKIADAARHVSQEAVQLHGGMGMTEELKISHTFRRLTVAAQQFGDADHHLERFAAL